MRHFVLYEAHLVHVDELREGRPFGDRGLVRLSTIRSVEKLAGRTTFVMKAEGKVYMFKVQPHDEATLQGWVTALTQALQRGGAGLGLGK